jgi:hypothetical protein
MAHRLKTLFVAMAALAAVSAFAASAAYAVPLFHSHQTLTTITAEEDGTGKTAHQVFDAGANEGITCKKISANATTSEETVTEITVKNIAYSECTFLGLAATVSMNGCHYLFTSHGIVHVECPANQKIEFSVPGCTVQVPPQTPTGGGVTFHNIGSTDANTTEVTVEANVTGIHFSSTGPICIFVGSGTNGEYTTGNAIVTGEKDGTTTMTPIWWA